MLVYLPAQDALFDNTTSSVECPAVGCSEFADTAILPMSYNRMSREPGFDIVLNELVYHGQRGHVLDYLTRDGWQTSYAYNEVVLSKRLCLSRRSSSRRRLPTSISTAATLMR